MRLDSTQLQQAPSSNDICAIVVTYHPGEGFLERLHSIKQQVGKVVIVDNHSSETWVKKFRPIADQLDIHFIENMNNLGIATALNQGVQYAIKCRYTWALTLDQDSLVEPNLVDILISAYLDCPFKEYVGIIGTTIEEVTSGSITKRLNDANNSSWLEVDEVITSGSLMPINVYNIVGPFRDDLFIDLVDFEYCLRLRACGYRIIRTLEVGLRQYFGTLITKTVMNTNILVRDYDPLRSYYRTRNGLLLIREYFWKDVIWSLRRFFKLCLRLVSTVVFEDNKIQKLKYTFIGIYHAVISKTGKIS
ncbi:glycosyltransferase family 2 protein [Gemmatimonadota bacterium]